MLKKFILSLLLLLSYSISIYSQSSSGSTRSIWSGSTLPSTCQSNGTNIFYKSDIGSIYTCTSTNTWTVVGSGVLSSRTINTTSPITGGGDLSADRTIGCATCGITGSPLSQFASTTSAQLANIISNKTGTGLLVFNISPSFTTPNIGAATGTSLIASGVISAGGTVSGASSGDITASRGTNQGVIFFGTDGARYIQALNTNLIIGGMTLTVTGLVETTGSNSGIQVDRRDSGVSAYLLYSASGKLTFYSGGDKWSFDTSGNFIAETDNTLDVGASGATRPRTGYFGTSIVTGNVISNIAGKGLQLQSGTGARAGNATLVGGTITVSNTTVTANTLVILTRKSSGGTIGTAITYSLNAGTSFTVQSDNILDTSTFSYMLIEVN